MVTRILLQIACGVWPGGIGLCVPQQGHTITACAGIAHETYLRDSALAAATHREKK